MNNIVSDINMGYPMVNIKKIINAIGLVLNITETIYVAPMKIVLDAHAYAIKQGPNYMLFIAPEILKKDQITAFNIKMFIHELCHIKQIIDNNLKVTGKIAI